MRTACERVTFDAESPETVGVVEVLAVYERFIVHPTFIAVFPLFDVGFDFGLVFGNVVLYILFGGRTGRGASLHLLGQGVYEETLQGSHGRIACVAACGIGEADVDGAAGKFAIVVDVFFVGIGIGRKCEFPVLFYRLGLGRFGI